jgi:type IV pilus assembly protein PilN
MIQINLLPHREARRAADVKQQGMLLLLCLIVCAGGIWIVDSRVRSQIERTQVRVRQMEQDIEQYKPQQAQVAAFREKKKELEAKLDVIEGLDRARSGPVRVMDELATFTPERLWLTRIATEAGRITLQGESLDNELVADFLRGLNASAYFRNVDLENTKLGAESEGLKLVNFTITAELTAPADEPAEAPETAPAAPAPGAASASAPGAAG